MKTLLDVRKERGITQEQLAELSGVTQTTISDIERGRVKSPTVETAGKLARALGVSIEDIFPMAADEPESATA